MYGNAEVAALSINIHENDKQEISHWLYQLLNLANRSLIILPELIDHRRLASVFHKQFPLTPA